MISEVTVSGDRQAGKSYLLIGAAIEEASRGEQVMYSTRCPTAMERFRDAERRAMDLCPDEVEKIYRGNGNQHIRFISGGELRFFGRGGDTPTVHVLDEVPEGTPPLISSRLKRVYRSKLT